MSMTERTKAKRVIAEIIRQAGGKFTGKTRLYKAFYVAHLLFAEHDQGYLTVWPIVRMPHGPGIDCGDELLAELELSGVLERKQVPEGPWQTTRYELSRDGRSEEKLSAGAKRAIKEAVEFVCSKSATELSELTHEFSRSWMEARDGQPLTGTRDRLLAPRTHAGMEVSATEPVPQSVQSQCGSMGSPSKMAGPALHAFLQTRAARRHNHLPARRMRPLASLQTAAFFLQTGFSCKLGHHRPVTSGPARRPGPRLTRVPANSRRAQT